MSVEPSLISELERRGASGDPRAASYSKRFIAIKDYLEANYYPYISDKCPYFTNHGKKHIDGVIRSSELLLLKRGVHGFEHLSTTDLYILLTAIIWHDTGMLVERKEHEVAMRPLISRVREIAFDGDLVVQRFVEEIIAAHTGKSKLQKLNDEEHYRDDTAHLRAMAAILRFADEVSEDASRISLPVLESGVVPVDQRVFWYYAKSIQASRPEPERERVVITVQLDSAEAIAEYDLPSDNGIQRLTLIEYLIQRIEKTHNERAYCAPYFARYATISSLVVRLGLFQKTRRMDGYDEEIRFDQIDHRDSAICGTFFKEHPKWSVKALKKAIKD